jgi:formylglycine-generating enzyme required for sulfatase activity
MKPSHAFWISASGLLLYSLLNSPALFAREPPRQFHDSISGLDFIEIPAGSFVMGTSDLEAAVAEMPEDKADLVADEAPAHRVSFEHSFYLATTEVTQKLWEQVMHTRPGPEANWQSTHWQQLPVVSVTWQETQDFISRLNAISKRYRYRLPGEAEWEYAARAGDSSLRPFSHLEMDEYAWYLLSSNDEIQPVAQLRANAFGLYDMFGNVWEWVSDWYQPDSYSSNAALNPQGPAQGELKVRRGGSFHCPAFMIRPAYRAADPPDSAYSVLGFRLVAEPR